MSGDYMRMFETKPKHWGSSLGITIPKKIVEEEGITSKEELQVIVFKKKRASLKSIFGTWKFKKPTQQIMDEIDEGYDDI